jgi:outer membrane protein
MTEPNLTHKYSSLGRVAVALLMLGLFTQVSDAQEAGRWSVAGGTAALLTRTSSSSLTAPSLPDTTIELSDAANFAVNLRYAFTNQWAVTLPLGTAYRIDFDGAGSVAGIGKVASSKLITPTLMVHYFFLEPSATFRPYLGLGATYARFFDESGTGALTGITNPGGPPTTLRIDSAFGPVAQIGVLARLPDKWFFDLSVAYSSLKTTAYVSTGQSIDFSSKPLIPVLTVGRLFY